MHTNTQRETHAKRSNTEVLAECLRSEISAVETYELALKGVEHVGLHHTLQQLLDSHVRRVEQIRDWFTRLGAEPPTGSGVWGAFAKLVQTGADLLGNRASIAALEEGEDHGLSLYTKDLDGCDVEVRAFIHNNLLAEQRRTHDLCRTLMRYTKEPS